ncbi:hypothetical protein BIY29_15695 [Brenneria alni]|uniref:Uncharacterized protein n=2 Tax=Brenneria alni TaxID=71656 RepID=A0A421DKP1_9GAMM|nr:hypothetical protein BIY29_15695 [Brenneria alni]
MSETLQSDDTGRLTRSSEQHLSLQAACASAVVDFGTTPLSDEDKPYKKRQAVRERWAFTQRKKGTTFKNEAVEARGGSTQRRSGQHVENSLWHFSKQRRDEFDGLRSTYNPSLSGAAFLRVIRDLTDAAHPLTNVQLPTERNDIRLFSIRVAGYDDDVYVLRRDTNGELRDLRRLRRPDDGDELHAVMAQMEKSAFQSSGRAAAMHGKSISRPRLDGLWESSRRRQEFQALYSAYRQLPGKIDTTRGHFFDELYKLTISAEKRGGGQETGVSDIRLFKIQVPGASEPVQILRRLNASGGLADIRLVSQTPLEEILDQMSDSHTLSSAVSAVLSTPRRDRHLPILWNKHLAHRLTSEWENFRRTQPKDNPVDTVAFVRHLDELCDKNPGEMADSRFGITRHTITPLGSLQPITMLRRKPEGEQTRMRVVDSEHAERQALRSLRAIGPKRKPDADVNVAPDKRRKILAQQSQQRGASTSKVAKGNPRLVGEANRASASQNTANVQSPPGTSYPQVYKVTVPQHYKERKVDIVHIVTNDVERMRGGPQTLESVYANSPELIRPPRSYESDRERQVLRWLCSALLNAFPASKEVQAYYDRASDEIWISSNSRGANRKIRMLLNEGGLQGELQNQIQAGKGNEDMNDRWLRHASRLDNVLHDRSARHPGTDPVLEAIARGGIRVSSERFNFTERGKLIDLHAERRIKQAYEKATGSTLDPNRLVGTKRPCGTCAEELQFPDDHRRGPFWQTRAANMLVSTASVMNTNIAKGIPTYISRDRNGQLNLYVSDSDSDD